MAEIVRLTQDTEKDIIDKITFVLKNSGIVVVPTDTVYGLVCDGEDDFAKKNIYAIKGRPEDKPLIAFVRDIEKAKKIAHIQNHFLDFVMNRWPGRHTFIFKSKIQSNYLVPPDKTIGIRVPYFNLINEICSVFPYLASTSANISFAGSASIIEEIDPDIKSRVSLIVDGGKLSGTESAIWDMTGFQPGLIRGRILFVCSGNSCRSPMAQFMLKQFISKSPIDVISAGTNTMSNSRLSQEVVEVMAETGIIVDDFITKQLTKEIIDSSDLVFTMEKKHRHMILQMSPSSCDKITVLDIPDPVGGNIIRYREVREIIKERIKTEVLTRIKK